MNRVDEKLYKSENSDFKGNDSIMYSFIVPVYNVETYLEMCISSLICQKSEYQYEIIIIDDGSKDASRQIAQKYANYHSNIKLYHQKNSGLSVARNVGIFYASGKWIIFVDSDDYLEQNFLEKVDQSIGKLTQKDIIIVDNLLLFEDKSTYVEQAVKEKKRRTGHLLNDILPLACGKVISKDLIKKYQLYFPENIHYEDMALFPVMAVQLNKCFWINEPLYIYRQRQDSISHSKNIEKMEDVLKAIDFCKEKMQKCSKEEKQYYEFFALQFALTTIAPQIVELNYKNLLVEKIVRYMERFFPNYPQNKYICKLSIRNQLYVWLLSRRKYKTLHYLIRIKKFVKRILQQKRLQNIYLLYKKHAI